jgi:hypothetical protein
MRKYDASIRILIASTIRIIPDNRPSLSSSSFAFGAIKPAAAGNMPRNSAYENLTGNSPSPSNTASSRKKQRTSHNDNDGSRLPSQAKGNPAYEQTWEDQALCCCGAECPRNSRIVAVLIILVGIGASIWTTEAATFFTFEAFRNDTFFHSDKHQPDPFQYATQADVGLFSYRLLQVFEYTQDYLSEDTNITIDEINAKITAESNLGQSQEYELGADQFPDDRAFSAAQTGSIWAPILAGVGLIFAIVELCFKRYHCSSLPTAICLFLAYCLQITTLFLFTSDDFWYVLRMDAIYI